MAQYVYQRPGGPLVYWTPGAPPRQTRAAEARSLGEEQAARGADFGMMGCGGDCGCSSCGSAKRYGMGGAQVNSVFTQISTPIGKARAFGGTPTRAIAVPRGQAQRYSSSLGTVPFIPGAPEPLTGTTPADVNQLID